jgi:uncharacterized protein with NAD-binding domain and iron-sulfur cluster
LALAPNDISALTFRNNLRAWMPVMRENNFNALRGSLQTEFIEPFTNALHQAGVVVDRGHSVTEVVFADDLVSEVRVRRDHKPELRLDVTDAWVVLALPVEVVQQLLFHPESGWPMGTYLWQHMEEVNEPDRQALTRTSRLSSRPMTAVQLHCRRRIPGVPDHHFLLRKSNYEISGLDISRVWDQYTNEEQTVLQLILSAPTELLHLDDDAIAKHTVDELARYFPIEHDDVDESWVLSNIDAPLFVNVVRSEKFRPRPDDTGVRNLMLAGDYCRTTADIACMEGAIESGYLAAAAIAQAEQQPPVEIRQIRRNDYKWFKPFRYLVSALMLPWRLIDDARTVVRSWSLRGKDSPDPLVDAGG